MLVVWFGFEYCEGVEDIRFECLGDFVELVDVYLPKHSQFIAIYLLKSKTSLKMKKNDSTVHGYILVPYATTPFY